jgi:NADPH-dependent 2,4-dienoyl-CoA reductase/sulfur reductase-like enzyme
MTSSQNGKTDGGRKSGGSGTDNRNVIGSIRVVVTDHTEAACELRCARVLEHGSVGAHGERQIRGGWRVAFNQHPCVGVSLEGGQRIEAALRVWAAGVKASPIAAKLDGLEVDRKGQIVVRPTLQSKEDDNVFAIGDCACCAGADGKPLPTTAQVARQHAIFLAHSLSRHLTKGKPLPEFVFRDMGSLVALGDYAAYGSLGNHGFLHWSPSQRLDGQARACVSVSNASVGSERFY